MIADMWCDPNFTNKLEVSTRTVYCFSGTVPTDVKHEIDTFLSGVFPANFLVKTTLMSVIYNFEYGKKTI